jgi:hypothetical protein
LHSRQATVAHFGKLAVRQRSLLRFCEPRPAQCVPEILAMK